EMEGVEGEGIMIVLLSKNEADCLARQHRQGRDVYSVSGPSRRAGVAGRRGSPVYQRRRCRRERLDDGERLLVNRRTEEGSAVRLYQHRRDRWPGWRCSPLPLVDFHAKLTHHFHRILTHPGS